MFVHRQLTGMKGNDTGSAAEVEVARSAAQGGTVVELVIPKAIAAVELAHEARFRLEANEAPIAADPELAPLPVKHALNGARW